MAARGLRRLAMTTGDWALIVGLVLISLGSIFMMSRFVGRGETAVVEVDGVATCRLDLSIDAQRAVVGPLGETVVEVRDGRIRVAESPCPHGICVRTGWTARAGDVIVCVPNRVVVRVEGLEEEGEVDARTW
jgi:hypothetical protein